MDNPFNEFPKPPGPPPPKGFSPKEPPKPPKLPLAARAELLFHQALELPSEEREVFVRNYAAGEEELVERVQQLLAGADAAQHFPALVVIPKKSPIDDLAERLKPEQAGDKIGKYTLIEEIGEGGFGVVWMAEQEGELRRAVALKILRVNHDGKEVVARFEQERQALAAMDHPNIAKIHDAGTTRFGRPYYVMELVRGVTITEYCELEKLSTRDRLALFIQVCRAVQHAHQKGLIHRDIKPSNVLVTVNDDEPIVKVIDFGVAKAIHGPLSSTPFRTHFDALVGTPLYMSPEQAGLSSLDIDTRSDIYSLGVLLYELLTDKTPFDKQRLLLADWDEMRRIIREEQPSKPSTQISSMDKGQLSSTATRRRTAAVKLASQLRGDLDWIVMKALEKDRKRRYDTSSALAEDIQRHLNAEPVLAQPPSTLYRFGCFVQRHRTGFVAGTAVAVAILAGLIVSLALLERTRVEAAKSAQIARFLRDMIEGVGPAGAEPRDTRLLEEILGSTAARMDTDLHNQPEVEMGLRRTLGRVYFQLGKYPKAEAAYHRALALAELSGNTSQPAKAEILDSLANAMRAQNRLPDAEKFVRQSLEEFDKLAIKQSAAKASALNDLGIILDERREYAEAESVHRRALAMRRELPGDQRESIAISLSNLGNILKRQRKLGESEEAQVQALGLLVARYGSKDLTVAGAQGNLANLLQAQGRLKEAEAYSRQAQASFENLLDADHPERAVAAENLARILQEQGDVGKFAEAEKLHRQALAILVDRPVGGEYLTTINGLAELLRIRGAFAEAETLFRREYAMREVSFERDWRGYFVARERLVDVLIALQRPADAEALLVNWYRANQYGTSPANQERLLQTARQIRGFFERVEQSQKAEQWATQIASLVRSGEEQWKDELTPLAASLARARAKAGTGSLETALALEALVEFLMQHGLYESAESRAREALKVRRALIPDDSQCLRIQGTLGECLLRQGKFVEAEPELIASYHGMMEQRSRLEREPINPVELGIRRLILFYSVTDQRAKVIEWKQNLGNFYLSERAAKPLR